MARSRLQTRHHPLREHSLSLILAGVILALLVLYAHADHQTHAGTFYGNAAADWLGVLAFVIATKYFVEIGSRESRQPSRQVTVRVGRLLQTHSLTIVLAITGLAWAIGYARSTVDSKGGELLGNIVSDWTQLLGLVVITKFARERGSKEGQ